MIFSAIPLRNLLQRPLRTTFTVGGIAVAVCSFTALLAVCNGLEHAWTNSLSERGTHMLATSRNSVDLLTGSLDESLAAEIRAVPGVEEVSGEMTDFIKLEDEQAVIATGIPESCHIWKSLTLSSGRLPAKGQPEAVLGANVAEALGKKAGDSIEIHNEPFTICGISRFAGAMNNSLLMMDLTTMQQMLGRPGRVTVFHIRITHPEDREKSTATHKALVAKFPGLQVNETNKITEDNKMFQLLHSAAWVNSVISIIMGLLVILNTVTMSVIERRADIGILTAVGWSTRRIVSMVIIEGLAVSTAGSVLGAAASYQLLALLQRFPQARGFLEVQVSSQQVIQVCAAALILGIGGSVYPAWRAARMDPVQSLRS
ncbi:MAG: ABC transporter permease [Candidatus Sumerlaeaceae bacterium]|nr:ABC transporter permease [Candidatus Sumerlaeaceae bacterium]